MDKQVPVFGWRDNDRIGSGTTDGICSVYAYCGHFFDEQKDKAETGKVDLQSRIQMVAFPKKLRTIQRVLCQSFSGYYMDNDS